MARTQPANRVHMPVDMDPAAYEYVGAFDASPDGPVYVPDAEGPRDFNMPDGTAQHGTNWLNAHVRWLSGLLERSRTSRYGSDRPGQCDHCGAHIRYVAVLRHRSGDHIAVGETCLDGRFALRSKAEFDRLRKMAALDRQKMRLIAESRRFLEPHTWLVQAALCDDRFLEMKGWNERPDILRARAHPIVSDMRAKLRRYGSLSDRQVAFAYVLAEEAAFPPPAGPPEDEFVPVPASVLEARRAAVEGEVLHESWRQNSVGDDVHKMLLAVRRWEPHVADETGRWKLWITVPSILQKVERGDVVRLACHVEISHDDPAFAFGKRPTKAEIVTAVDGSTARS